MKTPNEVNAFGFWESMHESLKALTKTKSYHSEIDFKYGGTHTVTKIGYNVEQEGNQITYRLNNQCKIVVPVDMPLNCTDLFDIANRVKDEIRNYHLLNTMMFEPFDMFYRDLINPVPRLVGIIDALSSDDVDLSDDLP